MSSIRTIEYPEHLKRALFDAKLDLRHTRVVLAWWIVSLAAPLAIMALTAYGEFVWIKDPDDEGLLFIPFALLGVLPLVIIVGVLINHVSKHLFPDSRAVKVAQYELRDYWTKSTWDRTEWRERH